MNLTYHPLETLQAIKRGETVYKQSLLSLANILTLKDLRGILRANRERVRAERARKRRDLKDFIKNVLTRGKA